MSTARLVPETRDLDRESALRTLRGCGCRGLTGKAFVRLRVADGFSHARSIAWITAMLFVEGIIALVGLATAFGHSELSKIITRTLQAAAPGPAGDFLTQTVTQAHHDGATHRYAGLVFGLVAALISGSTLFGQLERGFNRIYGVEQDRPTVKKYGLAFLLAISSGVLVSIAFVALAFGRTVGDSLHNDTLNDVWSLARYPLGLAGLTVAITLTLRWSPRRRQPRLSWLAFGALVAVVLWTAFTALLGGFFSLSTTFGDTYGPLTGVVALLLWAMLSAVSIFFGAAVSAELEAMRAGVAAPQDPEKVAHSEPEAPVRTLVGDHR